MKNEFNRTDGLFSLCGLNCGLCPMQIRDECSGCFNGSTCYQTCPIAPCSVKHGNVDYCFQCEEYPCKRYLLQYNMVLDFTEKVAQAKLPAGISKETFAAIQFIQNHTNAQIGIDEVAEAVGKSRSTLTRQFKVETGKTVTEFITESKLRDAKRLLRYSDMTLSEIASTLAFSSQPYFQTVFKSQTGLTPMDYRRKNNPLL